MTSSGLSIASILAVFANHSTDQILNFHCGCGVCCVCHPEPTTDDNEKEILFIVATLFANNDKTDIHSILYTVRLVEIRYGLIMSIHTYTLCDEDMMIAFWSLLAVVNHIHVLGFSSSAFAFIFTACRPPLLLCSGEPKTVVQTDRGNLKT